MKRYALLLSVAPLAVAAGAAQAQTTDTPTPGIAGQADTVRPDAKKPPATDRVVEGQAADATTDGPGAPAGTQAASDGSSSSGDVIVNGLRQSLATAASIKRNSDAILDAVVAQDIGKLPDDTAAESLARIAGVQVNRYGDEVNQVLIRGLPDVSTTVNGREFFTAELRRAQLQDFPAQALAGIEVYKSGTADLVEAGLAGLVNVRTRRPFDFKGLVVAGGARGTYNDESRKFDPGGNILVSDRWDTGIGEIGLLVNATYAQSQYHNGIRYNGTNITDSNPLSSISPAQTGVIRQPYNVGLYNPAGKRWRPSGNFALQWRPSSDLEVYLEGFYQGFRGQGYVDNYNVDLRGNNSITGVPVTLTDVVLFPGTNDVKSLVKTNGYRDEAYRSTDRNQTNTYQIASGAVWTTGKATLSTDFAYTTSFYEDNTHSLDSYVPASRAVVDFSNDGGAAFSLPNFNINDPNQYYWRGYYEAYYRVSGSGFQWRSDLSLDTSEDLPLLKKLQFGYRVTTRLARYATNSRYAYTANLGIPFSSLGLGSLELTNNPFRGSAQGFTEYLSYPFNDIDSNSAKLRDLSRQALTRLIAIYPNDQGYKDSLAAYQTDYVPIPANNTFRAKENTYAAYVQGKYGFSLGSIDIDGLLGVRAVITDGYYTGYSRTDNGPLTLTVNHSNYVDFLPNASLRAKLTPKLQLRLGYTFTRTKPDFGQLNPSYVFTTNTTPPSPTDDPATRINGNINSGNPDLQPLTSHNYDASLEWYFSKSGFLSGAVFYRDLFGFINNYTRFVNQPGFGRVQINEPLNSGEGRILGAEGNFQTFLDFLPGAFKGFGVSGNVTYLDGKSRNPSFNTATNAFTYGDFVNIIGLSKWSYNAAIFYERSGITTRLSYNRRSEFVNGYGTDFMNRQTANGTLAVARLDFSLSYDITKRFTASLDATNLLAKPFNDYVTDYYGFRYTQDVRYEGRYYGVGFRFRFGD